MPLSDTTVRTAKPRPKTYRCTDGFGLYLEIAPTGARYWRLKYRFFGKEKRLAIGVYPKVSLATARREAAVAREQLTQGIDPSALKRQRARAKAWWRQFVRKRSRGSGSDDQPQVDARSRRKSPVKPEEKEIFPSLGRRPIAELTSPEILDAIRKIEKRKAIDMAQRVRQRCSAVFAFAIGSAVCGAQPDHRHERIFVTRKKVPYRMLPSSRASRVPAKARYFQGRQGHRLACALSFSPWYARSSAVKHVGRTSLTSNKSFGRSRPSE